MDDKFYNLDYYLKDDVLYKVLGINGDNPPTKEQELFIDWLHNFAKIYKKTKQEFVKAYTASCTNRPQIESLYKKTATMYTKWCEETKNLPTALCRNIDRGLSKRWCCQGLIDTYTGMLRKYNNLTKKYDKALSELQDELGDILNVNSIQDARLVLNKIEEEILNNPISEDIVEDESLSSEYDRCEDVSNESEMDKHD